MLRYVVISDDADVPTIDLALAALRTKQRLTTLAVSREWIGQDIDALLEMRLTAEAPSPPGRAVSAHS